MNTFERFLATQIENKEKSIRNMIDALDVMVSNYSYGYDGAVTAKAQDLQKYETELKVLNEMLSVYRGVGTVFENGVPENIDISDSNQTVDGKIVQTKIAEITNANIIEVEVGTNGLHGGDTGHGSRTYFRIRDLGSTDITAKSFKDDENGSVEVEIELGGDTELETFIQALEFAIKTLKEQENSQDE